VTNPVHPCAGLLASSAKWFSGARVRWIDCPAEPRPRVYFANHSSHLDFVVLWAALPQTIRTQTRPVAAQEYWESSWLRSYLATRVFQSLLVPRLNVAALAGREALSPLLEQLDLGGSLILFPEGTRGDGTEVAEFKSGLCQLCRERPEVEAVPVYLENLNHVLPKGGIIPKPLGSRVTFGPPLRTDRAEDSREFLSRARQALRELRDR
jgi:1-acyl-sn-glycerol-3-phosphate acyltransferase